MPAQTETYTQQVIRSLLARAAPGVVGLADGASGGSGFVVQQDRVLTLARNLRREQVSISFFDGERQSGRVLATDPDLGIAMLEVATGERPLASWPDEPAAPEMGVPVYALADPGGRGLRVTAGAVASAPQSLRGPRGRMLEGLIEHTAPLPRGSGGGPLLDSEGRLLGINAVRLAHGLILALPGSRVRERLADLASGAAPPRRRLGVAIVSPRMTRRLRGAVGLPERDGLLVRGVERDSPAARGGLQRGDLIVSFDRREVASLDQLLGALDAAALGQPLALGIVRGAEERELEIALEDDQ